MRISVHLNRLEALLFLCSINCTSICETETSQSARRWLLKRTSLKSADRFPWRRHEGFRKTMCEEREKGTVGGSPTRDKRTRSEEARTRCTGEITRAVSRIASRREILIGSVRPGMRTTDDSRVIVSAHTYATVRESYDCNRSSSFSHGPTTRFSCSAIDDA